MAVETSPTNTVGVVGLGGMGSGIAATLLKAGYDLIVFDLDKKRMEDAVSAGAVAAVDMPWLADRCGTVVLSLPTSGVTVHVMESELLPSMRAGSTIIDMGTTLVRETERLNAALSERGIALLDAPVSGGVGGAAKGHLFVFVGGERDAFETQRELLEAVGGARVTYCGESGYGQVAKGVNQLAMGLVEAAFMEALAFGVNSGISAETLSTAVGGDSGFRAQLRAVAERVMNGGGDAMDAKFAEYNYFLDEAQRRGFSTPILTALSTYVSDRPKTAVDNMNRPYAPLWSALTDRP